MCSSYLFPGTARLTHTVPALHRSCHLAYVLQTDYLTDRLFDKLSQGQAYRQDMLLSSSISTCPISKVLPNGFSRVLPSSWTCTNPSHLVMPQFNSPSLLQPRVPGLLFRWQGGGPGAAQEGIPLCVPSTGTLHFARGQGRAGLPVPQPHPQGSL